MSNNLGTYTTVYGKKVKRTRAHVAGDVIGRVTTFGLLAWAATATDGLLQLCLIADLAIAGVAIIVAASLRAGGDR